MNLLKAALLMSALVVLSEAKFSKDDSENWDKWLSCTHIGTKATAKILRGTIPALRTLYKCIDFEPLRNDDSMFNGLRHLKNLHQFLKRSVYEKMSCLLDPLKGAANALEPFIERIDRMRCLAN